MAKFFPKHPTWKGWSYCCYGNKLIDWQYLILNVFVFFEAPASEETEVPHLAPRTVHHIEQKHLQSEQQVGENKSCKIEDDVKLLIMHSGNLIN